MASGAAGVSDDAIYFDMAKVWDADRSADTASLIAAALG